MEVEYQYYELLEKPRWFFQSDDVRALTFQLRSPISGLLVDLRETWTAYRSDYRGATTSGRELVYGNQRVVPLLLVPQDEPPADGYAMSFYSDVGRFLNQCSQVLLTSHAEKGYVRLSEVLHEYDTEKVEEASRRLQCGEEDLLNSFPVISFNCSNRTLLDRIQNLRAHCLGLRDQLVHLVKDC